MRKTFTTIALIAVLASMSVSCQKENLISQPTIVNESCTTYMMQYTIDGVSHTITLIGKDTWHDFLNHMFTLAEEGHMVSFRNVEFTSNTTAAKETVIHTTTNKDEAFAWALKMHSGGYAVSIEYDKEKKIYICYAIR